MTEPTPTNTIASHVSRKWMLRIVLIALVLIGFGFWGLYDAKIAYPRRGERASEWLEHQYLDQYGRVRGGLDSRASIDDVTGEIARLRNKQEQVGPLDAAEAAALAWLESLAIVGRTEAASATKIPRTDFRGDQVTDARARLDELNKKFTSAQGQAQAPTPLASWDIPVQWLITVLGFGIGAYMLVLVMRVKGRTFTYAPDEKRLTLPGGASFVPSDIEDVDKRLWHKYYVEIRIKPGHAQLGGKNVKLDLMRYEPVEEWVLEMERAAFPDRAETAKPEPTPENAPASAPAP